MQCFGFTVFHTHTDTYIVLFYRSSERKITDSVSVLGVPQNIQLDEDETIVRQLLEQEDIYTIPFSMVTLQPKLKIRKQVNSSKCQKRVKKKKQFYSGIH